MCFSFTVSPATEAFRKRRTLSEHDEVFDGEDRYKTDGTNIRLDEINTELKKGRGNNAAQEERESANECDAAIGASSSGRKSTTKRKR